MEKKERKEVLVNIREVFENDLSGEDDKLQALQKLKCFFKPQDRVFSKIKVESLLQSARFALECKIPEKEFLFNYGTALAGFVGKEPGLDAEILYQLEYILKEVNKFDERKAYTICRMLWNQLEGNSLALYSGALIASKQTLEEIVLSWVEATGHPFLDFPAMLAAASPQLFQILTTILYEIVIRFRGHEKIIKVTELFINTVMQICRKEGKDFLGLYPKNCRRLVALLMVSPEVFNLQNLKLNEVNSLLFEMFSADKGHAMILLSHYSLWVQPFKKYLEERGDT